MTRMEQIKEKAYGIIPFYKDEKNLYVFVIHQYGSAGNTLWTFPKGRQEAGETLTETALREVKEETGIEFKSYDENTPYSISYSFVRNGKKIEKVTTYFVGFAKSRRYTLQTEEIKEAAWFPVKEARERLTYDGYRELLDKIVTELDK